MTKLLKSTKMLRKFQAIYSAPTDYLEIFLVLNKETIIKLISRLILVIVKKEKKKIVLQGNLKFQEVRE